MKILALMALAALVGCSRSDKIATEEPAITITVVREPIVLPPPSDEELDRRATAALVAQPDLAQPRAGITASDDVLAAEGTEIGVASTTMAEISLTRPAGFEATLNELTTRPLTQREHDDRVAFGIYLALGRDPEFVAGATDIDVRVVRGVATLQGNTATPEERAAGARIAARQAGVVRVDNQLRLAPPPARARPDAR
jgi:osmotically-inducible protein OsmY